MHVFVATCLIVANALSAAPPAIRATDVAQDTTAAARTSAVGQPLAPVRGVTAPALGTVESAVSISFSMTEGMMTPLDWREPLLLSDSTLADTTTRSQRPRAIEYSDAYHTRLKIHQIGAYAMLPLFIGEYFVGQKLLNSTTRPQGLRSAHSFLAGAVGVVFATNTVTGAWNLWDARKDPKGRTRREIHSALMLASDAGVLLTAISGSNANHSLSNARTHRTIAISSIALSAVGTGMMWLWRDR